MRALAEFQREFARSLLDPQASLRHQYGPGLAVYQNTVMKGLLEVLRANYPTVERLVGATWFDSLALRYAREHLPQQPPLSLYGAGFAEFIHDAATAQGLHYLSSVAQLDRDWTEVHFAADAPQLQAGQLQTLTPAELQDLTLQRHTATRVAWLPHSAVSIWMHNRPPATPPETLAVDDVEQGVLLTRVAGAVVTTPLQRADHDFLQHLLAGLSLGDAAIAVLQQHPQADIATLLATLLHAGAFATFDHH